METALVLAFPEPPPTARVAWRRPSVTVPLAAGGKGRSIVVHAPFTAGREPAKARWTMVETSDEDLMAQVSRGDQRAFHGLVARHHGPAFRIADRLLRNRADAEDVVQEAMLRVWVQAPTWRPAALFRTWLYRVVVNLAIDRHRQRQRRGGGAPVTEADTVADPGPDPAARAAQGEVDGLVAAAVAALPERQRAALVLAHYEGLSNSEAAAVLDTSVSGIEALLVRARRALRARLEPLLRD